MTSRKAKDEVGQRKFARDAKGRFAARPIKPLPVNMKPQISKWSTEDEEEDECCGRCATKTYIEPLFEKFKKLQPMLNPKKDCKNVFEGVHNYLIASGGMLSKVIDRNTNKPYGYLIRIPSSTNPDIVFMRFVKHDDENKNTYFQKANAIVSTLICGERWLEKRNKMDCYIDDIPFCIYYIDTNRFLDCSNHGLTSVQIPGYISYVQGRRMNEAEREGYTLTKEMKDYINRFEQKAREYYKNNGKNKKFIALPFT